MKRFVVAGVIAVASFFTWQHMAQDRKPGLFLNTSSKHTYDRAYRGSILYASKRSGIEYALVMLDKLPAGETVESYAPKIFHEYKLGHKTKGKALLFLSVEEPAQMKIEVSYSLEAVFPDIVCAELERAARSYMLSGNQRDFITDLIVTTGIHYEEYRNTGKLGSLEFPFDTTRMSPNRRLSGGAGITGRNYAADYAAIQAEIRKAGSEDLVAYQPSDDPQKSLERYFESLKRGIGDPALPLLTPGSQYNRQIIPLNVGFFKRTWNYISKALPYVLSVEEKLGAAVFRSNNPVFPILLRKNTAGYWLIDEAGAWAHYHRFEGGGDFVPKYPNSPYAFAYAKAHHPLANSALYPSSKLKFSIQEDPEKLYEKIRALENAIKNSPSNADAYFELADLLYFEAYDMEAAIPLYENGLDKDPKRIEYHWRLADLYLNTTRVDELENRYKKILELNPNDRLAKSWLENTKEFYGE